MIADQTKEFGQKMQKAAQTFASNASSAMAEVTSRADQASKRQPGGGLKPHRSLSVVMRGLGVRKTCMASEVERHLVRSQERAWAH
jgi:hypothetical protein